jgi:hypothetical protein
MVERRYVYKCLKKIRNVKKTIILKCVLIEDWNSKHRVLKKPETTILLEYTCRKMFNNFHNQFYHNDFTE